MIHVLIYIDRKMAISAGNYQCGDVLVKVDPAELSVKQREELFKLKCRRLAPNSSDKTEYYDLTGRFYEPGVEYNDQIAILKSLDIEHISKKSPFPTIGSADKDAILSLLDASIIRREYISSYLDEQQSKIRD